MTQSRCSSKGVLSPPLRQVPVIRNRRRLLGVIESPWDSFGPPAPTMGEADYTGLSKFLEGEADDTDRSKSF